MILRPKNWHEFQHYSKRNPPWIKLHRGLLDDFEFQCLPVASRALAPLLWLLASESIEGEIRAEATKISFRLRMSENDFMDALKPLITHGFIIDASNMLAPCKPDATPETETETEGETKTEKRAFAPKRNRRSDLVGDDLEWFEKAWKRWPSVNVKDGSAAPISPKHETMKRFEKILKADSIPAEVLAYACGIYCLDREKDGIYLKSMETFLGPKRCWADYLERAKAATAKQHVHGVSA